jgi:hypothetical protein
MQIGKTTEQISYRDRVLPRLSPSIDRVDPLVRGPSPERPSALLGLAKKEKQSKPALHGLDAGVVESIV